MANGPVDVIDLFAGCGGLSTGFEHFGRRLRSFRLAGAADIDAHAVRTYARNLGLQPVLTDLFRAAASEDEHQQVFSAFRRRPGHRLVLVGGPPCQGFSAHRKKDASTSRDDRNHLVVAYARIIARVQPDVAILENVPELLAEKHWKYFVRFASILAEYGYRVRAQIHNLAGFGVPQERFRALIIASRGPFRMPEPYLTRTEYRSVRSAIGGLPPVSPGRPDPSDPMHVCSAHRPSTIATIQRVPPDGGRRPRGVGPACLDRVEGFRDVYGRMFWDKPANTITAFARNPASGRYVHPEQHRGLTVREAALLQGFPLSFQFDGPFDHRFLQIGNAVPPIFATYLAGHVFAELEYPLRDGDSDPTSVCDVTEPTSDSFSSGIAGRKKRKGAA